MTFFGGSSTVWGNLQGSCDIFFEGVQIHGITHAGPVVFVANPWCFRHLPICSILIWAAANDHAYGHDDEDGDDGVGAGAGAGRR
jgi:hypothetical protein